MLTSYEVGAVFRIADHASPTLLKLSSELQKVERLAISVKTAFDGVGKVKVPGLTNSFNNLAGKLTLVTDKAILAEKALGTVGKTGTLIGGAAREAAALQKELAAAVKEGNALSRIRPPNFNQGGGGGAHPRPGQRGHNGGHRAGEVGLQLGIFGGIGAHEVADLLKDAFKKGMEFRHVQEQMHLGGQDRDAHSGRTGNVRKASGAAWDQAYKTGLPVAGILGDIKELALPFGSIDHAIEFIEPLEKMKIVLNAMSEGKGTEARDAVYKMARAGELKGLTEAKDFNSYFDSMTKAITASGGKITPNSFAQVTQYGKLASFGWNEEFYTKYLPTLMQTMNPSTAGQSLMSLYSTIGGTAKGDAVIAMDKLGLIGDRTKLKVNDKGKITGMRRGALAGTDVFTRNPIEWARDYLLPKLEAKYGDLNVAENKEKAIGAMGELFGNRNSAAAAAELALRLKSFDRDHAMIGQASGIGAAAGLADKDPTTAINRLKGSWENFMTMLGGPGVQAAIGTMNALSTALIGLTKFGNEHPEAMKTVLGALTGLGVALAALAVAGVIAGAVLLGPGGAVAVAVTTLVGVLGGIAAANWDKVKAGFATMKEVLGGWVDWLHGIVEKVRGYFGSGVPGQRPSAPGEGVVPNSLITPGAFDGAGFGGASIIKAAFSTSGAVDAGSADERFAKAVYVGVLAALKDFGGSGGGGGGFGGGGGGFHRASFGGGGGIGSSAGIGPLGNAPAGSLTELINREALAAGIDPRIMQGIRAGESLHTERYDVKDDRIESSWGPFQLNRRKGLGVQFEKETGLDVRDPRTIPAQARWVAQFLRKGGSLRNWAGYHGPRNADPSWGNSGLVTGDFGGLGVVNGEVRVKAGAGSASSPLAALAADLQRGGGVNRFTAFNDRHHAGTGSMHARGLAADVTGDPEKIMANARALMEAAGLSEGKDFRLLNEYKHRSRRWTGGHVHVQFQTPEAAAAYEAAQRAKIPPTAGAPPKPKASGQLQPIQVNLGGHRVATVMHRVMAQHATHPTSAGAMDAHGHYRAPGTPLVDAA